MNRVLHQFPLFFPFPRNWKAKATEFHQRSHLNYQFTFWIPYIVFIEVYRYRRNKEAAKELLNVAVCCADPDLFGGKETSVDKRCVFCVFLQFQIKGAIPATVSRGIAAITFPILLQSQMKFPYLREIWHVCVSFLFWLVHSNKKIQFLTIFFFWVFLGQTRLVLAIVSATMYQSGLWCCISWFCSSVRSIIIRMPKNTFAWVCCDRACMQ